MPDFRDLFEDYEESAPIWFGIIAEDALNFSDEVPVIIPSFDSELQWGPCKWQSRDNATLPQQGDRCALIFDDQRNPWIVVWWPEAGMSSPVPSPPTGSAGGDLSGTYPNPQIAAGTIVNADVAAAAAIAQNKLAPIQIAHIRANAQPTSASGETQLTSMIETDAANLGTIVSNTYRIDVAGAYLLLPSMYTFNLGGGSLQSVIVRLNPAGGNAVVTEVSPNSGISVAGGDRWLGGTSAVVGLNVNDVIRLNGTNSEATPRDVYGYLVLIKVN